MDSRSINFAFFKGYGDKYSWPNLYNLCLLTTRHHNPNTEINLHTDCIDLLTKDNKIDLDIIFKCNINIVDAKPRNKIYGNIVKHPVHRVDIFKLDMMKEYGGLWVDLDTICSRSYDMVLNTKYDFTWLYEFVRGTHQYCMSFIQIRDKEFLEKWIEAYKDYEYKFTKEKYAADWDTLDSKFPYTLFNKEYKDKEFLLVRTFGFGLEPDLYDEEKNPLIIKNVLEDNLEDLSLRTNHFHLCSYLFSNIYELTIDDWKEYKECTLSEYIKDSIKWFEKL